MNTDTAVEIAADVHTGRRSPQDVVETSLARIDALDPRLGAFQVVATEAARAEAAALSARTDLASLPLAGVPVAIKDNIDVAGLPTRHGSAATSTEPAAADDELVRRLRAAGAIVVGKTRMPELSIWPAHRVHRHGRHTEPARPVTQRRRVHRRRRRGGGQRDGPAGARY